ncbi:ABC transporter ATP-binding protein [Bosea sp. (in: a-proteobacteria)]|uniref:ABC transporter ATP-binding protein n=1 Tax=Bosea sp. (in: a-proteobacteria) TaxID=1871050 RepID=UPI0027348702|nr:ABC transporter ATP-binding protein [Bosea sp. (in: a-proteobacteria)]MDP3410428.1 ABC transporter ATP-binding protein [Bosea sp. (in: a-proteobacteria)]
MADDALAVTLRQTAPIPLDLSLSCAAGDVLAMVGPSGSGKTTILRTIAGLYRPAVGQVSVGGASWLDTSRRIDLPPYRRRVGLVFQNYALFPHMTALANVAAALGHLPRPERSRRAGELLELVHLADLHTRRPAELSGGQQQRVAVARALARDPDVLLLDEPFSAVDRVTRQRLYGELRDLSRAFPIPILVVTHDFDEAARVANRMCLLDRGRILQTGTPRDVLARPASVQAARLVDLKNIFSARIVAQDGPRTWLDWNGRRIETPRAESHPVGADIAWAIAGTQVLLSRTDLDQADSQPNRFAATIRDLVHLSESLAVTVVLDGQDAPLLSMTLPAHYARRTGLGPGSAVTVALMPEGIHIMAREGEGQADLA